MKFASKQLPANPCMSNEVSMTLLRAIDEDAWREAFAILNQDVQKIADAVVASDVAYVDSVLSPDFVMVHGDQWTVGGEPLLIDDKQSFLRRVANQYYATIQFDSVRAEMHGDVAITYGRYVASIRANAGTDRAWFYVWYERVFAERDGRWMYLSHRTVHGPIFGPSRESLSGRTP